MSERPEIYVPSVARFPDDLRARYDLLEPAREKGYKTGLMLVLRQGDFSAEETKKQLGNLDPYVKLGGAERPAVFAMHPNMPLEGKERLNLLDNPGFSREYIEQGIELAARIPDELSSEQGRAISFHLNTLIKPQQWTSDKEYWAEAFAGVLDTVRKITTFGKEHGVKVAIETVPIPEFGDIKKSPKSLLGDGHTYWADLGNPWPLLFWRDEIAKVRAAGSGLAIDICHSFVALRAVHEIGRLIKSGKKNDALSTYMVHEDDVSKAPPIGQFGETVIGNTQRGDIWHMNDAKSAYATPRLHGDEKYFEEGIALFDGDIPADILRKLIRAGLEKQIKFVLEINEKDFKNNPSTKKSLDFVLRES